MLKEKTIKGVGWNAAQHIGRQGIRFVISIILARMLLPEHYGVVGIVLVFIAISRTLVNSGFGQALIQKKDATYIDECSIFYTNIFLSVLIYLILWLAAPVIARFYGMPQLDILIKVLGVQLIIQSFGLIHSTLLTKRINFKTQTVVTLTSIILSGAIGITMAFNGFGIWSLVCQSLCSSTINMIGLWMCSSWRPSLSFSFQSIRQLFGFGSKVLASGLLDSFFRNIYTVVIGKLFPPAALGLYARGNSLVQLPTQNLAVIARRVIFPIFSSINDDRARIKRGMKKVLVVLFFLNCPIVVGLVVTADTLVYVLLTEKWAKCIPYIRLISLGVILYPLHLIHVNSLLSIGRSDLNLRNELIKKILTAIAIAITYRWGIEAMIIGQVVQGVFAYFINGYYSKHLFQYTYWEQIRDVLPYVVTSVFMGVCVYSLEILHFDSLVFKFCCQIFMGITVYLTISYVLRLEAFREIVGIIQLVLTNKRNRAIVSG